jgi:hypothetical protein
MGYGIHDYLEDMEPEGYLLGGDELEVMRVVRNSRGVQTRELVVDGKSWGWVDAGLAEVLERINKAGYQSAQSCSGLQRDHEHKQTTTGGYISWFASDLNEEQVEAIEVAASKAGLVCKHSDLFFAPAISVRAEWLKDGSSTEDARLEASAKTNAEWGVDKRPDDERAMAWLKRQGALWLEGIKQRGGLAINTDEAQERAWTDFADALLDG